jgi:flavodoxin
MPIAAYLQTLCLSHGRPEYKISSEKEESVMKKLVVYFSYSGVTAARAEKLAKQYGAELFELKAKVPYSASDVNWRDENSRNVLEYKDPDCRPAIEAMPDLSGVDEIWVGYPIWWYTHPRMIDTFFDEAPLEGIAIHLFATSGGSGIDKSFAELKKAHPSLSITDAKRI